MTAARPIRPIEHLHPHRRPNTWLLGVLLAALVLYPALHDKHGSAVAFNVIRTLLLLAGLRVAFVDHPLRAFAVALAVVSIVGAWASFVVPGRSANVVALEVHATSAVFLLFTVVVVLRLIFRQPRVTFDTVCGALCGYLLVGVAFGHFYTILATADPQCIRGIDLATDARAHFSLTYFSFVTLTTVGYGDITPVSDMARSMAVLEAVIGQFYMAVLIAGLIGKWISQPAEPQPAASPS